MAFKFNSAISAAESLMTFMAKMDQLTDNQSEQLAEWCKEQERSADTNAEKHFLLAARSYVLDYPAELNELVPR
jgi:hypothetical protein